MGKSGKGRDEKQVKVCLQDDQAVYRQLPGDNLPGKLRNIRLCNAIGKQNSM